MKGATSSEVIASGNEIAVHTHGAACGKTFSVFAVDDQDLRERTVRAMRPGVEVHETAAAAI
jgi:hypothetical protein